MLEETTVRIYSSGVVLAYQLPPNLLNLSMPLLHPSTIRFLNSSA
jgi:hypothetical protein